MKAKTAAQRGRASRNKGAAWERAVAAAVRPWFPDAKRARDNGSTNTPDAGDIDGTGPEFFWSCKDDREGDTSAPAIMREWLDEARQKAAAAGRTPLLVQKRRGHTDPLDAWCWASLADLVYWTADVHDDMDRWDRPVRMVFRDVLEVLVDAGLTFGAPAEEAS